MFRIQIFAAVDDCYTSAEVLYDEVLVAIVYERSDGWKIELFQSPPALNLEEFVKAIDAAKLRLQEYINRLGEGPPEGLSAAGLSLWLMEKTDGTAMGLNLHK